MASDKTLIAMIRAGERIANAPMPSADNPWVNYVSGGYRINSSRCPNLRFAKAFKKYRDKK